VQSCTSIDISDTFFNWLFNIVYQYVPFLCRFLKGQAMWTSVMLSTSCHLAQSIQELITNWMKLQGYFMTQVEASNTISRWVAIHLAFVIKHVHEKASKSQHLGNIADKSISSSPPFLTPNEKKLLFWRSCSSSNSQTQP